MQQQQQHQLISIALPLPQLLIASVAATILQATATTRTTLTKLNLRRAWPQYLLQLQLQLQHQARRCGAAVLRRGGNSYVQQSATPTKMPNDIAACASIARPAAVHLLYLTLAYAVCTHLLSLSPSSSRSALLPCFGHALNNFTLCLPSRRMQMR